MEPTVLTQEQLDAIIAAVLTKAKIDLMRDIINKTALADILKDFVTKDQLNELKTSVSQDIAKTNEAVTKVASETETKIKALQTSPPEIKKHWFDRELI